MISPGLLVGGRLLARNALLGLAAQLLPLAVAVAAIPILVDRLGLPRLGILSLAWVILGYAGALDLGIARAATKRTTELLMIGDRRSLGELASSAIAANLVIGTVVGLISWIVLPGFAGPAFRIPSHLVPEAADAFAVLSIGLPIALAVGAARGLLEGAQRFDLLTAVGAPSAALIYVLPAIGSQLDLSLAWIIALLVASRTASLIAYVSLVPRAFREMRPSAPRWTVARALLRYGGWLTISGASAPVIVYGERAIIASLLAIGGLSLYVIPYELVARVWVIPAALAATLYPAFTAMAAAQAAGIGPTLGRSVSLLIALLGPPAVVLVSFSVPVLRAWLGPDVAAEAGAPLQVFAVGAALTSLAYVPLAFLQASGRARTAAFVHITQIPLTYILTWWLTMQFGLVGAAWAWASRVAADAALLFVLVSRASPDVAHALPAIIRSLGVLAIGVAAGFLSSSIEPLAVRAVAAAVTVTLMLALHWRIGLDVADRELLASWVRRVGSG